MRVTSRWVFTGICVAALLAGAATADAGLVINRTYLGGTAPSNAVGGGSLQSVFNAAADWWEMAIGTNHTVALSYGWGALSGGTLGVHVLGAESGTPIRETSGTLTFDNDLSSLFFIDATPRQNEEWAVLTSSSANLGGGVINTGRVFTSASGAASGAVDLFSVVLHEIGHSLGLSSAATAYQNESWPDNDIDVIAPRPFAGSTILTNNGSTPATVFTSNAHLTTTTTLMYYAASPSVRKYGSAVDILAMAELSDFTVANFDPQFTAIPEPTTIALLGLGFLAVGLRVRRRKSRSG